MALLAQNYKAVEKPNDAGQQVPFTPLRAVGLAVELAHKVARDSGRGSVTAAALGVVRVSGSGVRILHDEQWKSVRNCRLRLQGNDAELAMQVFLKQRSFLCDLAFNIWQVDVGVPGGALDLVGDFSLNNSFDIAGKVWVELKVFSSTGFERKVEQHQDLCSSKLPSVQGRDPSIEAVMLVACRCARNGPRHWLSPSLRATIYLGGQWQDIGGAKKKSRGRVQGEKKNLAAVWKEMEWLSDPRGGSSKLGFLKHFLAALGLKAANPGQRARRFNALLAQHNGHAFERIKIPHREGKRPWVGAKAAFRIIYNAL